MSPPDVLRVAALNLTLDRAAAEVVTALRAAAVPTILLKGAVLRNWPIPDPARTSVDVDLLVRPDCIADAERVLERMGLVSRSLAGIPHDRPWSAHIWESGPYGVKFDIHESLFGVGVPPDIGWQILRRETEEFQLGAATVEVLAPAGRAMHIAIHAAQHGADLIQPIGDLRRALQALPFELWQQAAVLAERLEATQLMAAGLRLLPAGEELATRLRLPLEVPPMVALLTRSPPPMAGGFEWFSRIPDGRARARFLARKLFPPREWLRNWAPVARRGPLGLAAAYVWRPIWLGVHAGPAYLAWRRARARGK